MSIEQLPLNVSVKTHYRLENFLPGKNQAVVDWLIKFAENQKRESQVLLWGDKGVGKTHLISALCNHQGNSGYTHFYLAMDEYDKIQPSVVEHVEFADFIILDNIHLLAGNKNWEIVLFDLYNRAMENQCQLLMTSDRSPQTIGFQLADLQSRIMQCLALRLDDLSEEEKRQILQQRAEAKGLRISDEVFGFLLRHYRRDLASLSQALEILDRASLIQKRRITIPFIKQVLSIQ